MKDYDALYLVPVQDYSSETIRALRELYRIERGWKP